MQQQHVYTPDDNDLSCSRCGMPRRNRWHTTAEELDTRPANAVAHDSPVTDAAPVIHPHQRSTSIDAGMMLRGTAIKALVYQRIAWAENGLTDDELLQAESLAGKNPNTVRPRRIELARQGVIEPMHDADGTVVTRATSGGAQAVVWALTTVARAEFAAATEKVA